MAGNSKDSKILAYKDMMIIPLRRSRLSGKTETICPDRRKPLNLLLCEAKPHVCYCA